MSENNLLEKILSDTVNGKKASTKKEKVVATAIRLFSEKGYANTSTAEIAEIAGVSEGTIFKHYGTKENLLFAIMKPFIRSLYPVLSRELIDALNPDELKTFDDFLKILFSNRLRFIEINRDVFRIVIKELLYREELRNKLMPYLNNEVFNHIYHILDIFKDKGEIKDISNPILLRTILTSFAGYFVFRFIILPDSFTIDEQDENYLIQIILNGVKK